MCKVRLAKGPSTTQESDPTPFPPNPVSVSQTGDKAWLPGPTSRLSCQYLEYLVSIQSRVKRPVRSRNLCGRVKHTVVSLCSYTQSAKLSHARTYNSGATEGIVPVHGKIRVLAFVRTTPL